MALLKSERMEWSLEKQERMQVYLTGQFAMARDETSVTSSIKAFARSVPTSSDRIIAAYLLFHEIVIEEPDRCQTLLQCCIRKPHPRVENADPGSARIGARSEVMHVAGHMLSGCMFYVDFVTLTEAKVVLKRTSVGVNRIRSQAEVCLDPQPRPGMGHLSDKCSNASVYHRDLRMNRDTIT
jgi:hypothetical protein